jgi:MFS superfamily sulfate permease-like transporter
VAVEVGLVLACAFFIYRMGTLFQVRRWPRRTGVQADTLPLFFGRAWLVFELFGSLFFGAVGKIDTAPCPTRNRLSKTLTGAQAWRRRPGRTPPPEALP